LVWLSGIAWLLAALLVFGGGNKSDTGLDSAQAVNSETRKHVLRVDTLRIFTNSPLRINASMVALDIQSISTAVSILTMMGWMLSLVFI
jgi:hypothetical protein